MPTRWLERRDNDLPSGGSFSFEHGDAPAARLMLWPYRSLPQDGFAWFIGVTALLISIPLFPLLGTPVLWGILPFIVLVMCGLWIGLRRSYRSADTQELLTLWSDRVEIIRQDPNGTTREWQANPYWVTLDLNETGGPVPQYLTLSGAGRQVELGAFLSEDERVGLHDDLSRLIRRVSVRPPV